MTFNEWLVMEFGQGWQGINDDLICEGWGEDERSDHYDKLASDYEDYCETEEIEPEY